VVRRKIDEIEAECLRKIKDSDLLKEVAANIDYLHDQCDDELIHLVEE
jgi:hypothetical protein